MAQIDDLNAAVAAAQQAVSDLMTRDAAVVAGVQALQTEVSNLEQQLANIPQAPDLSGVTAAVNNLAATVATADTEPTDVPQPPQAAPAAGGDVNNPSQPDVTPQPGDQPTQ